jgi:hypothetical protein
MTALKNTVRLQFQIGEPNGFILSQTPLGSTRNKIAGLEDFRLDQNAVLDADQLDGAKNYWLNVLDDTASITIQRGMAIGAGGQPFPVAGSLTAQIASPEIDPFNSIQFRPNLKVRCQVFFQNKWQNLFTGRLREINSEYDVDGNVLVDFEATDAIDDLNQIILDNFTVPAEKTGKRIARVLREGGLDSSLVPESSHHTFELQAENLNQNALDACLDAVSHEMGSMFVTKSNKVQFLKYGETNEPAISNPIFTNTAIDTDNQISMTNVGMSSGKELFFNKCIATTANDENIYVKQGSISIQRYGLQVYENRSLKFDLDLPMDENGDPIPQIGAGQTKVFNWLDKFLARWADTPQEITYVGTRRYPRTVQVINRMDSLKYPILAEVGDEVEVNFQTPYVDLNQKSMILGIRHSLNPTQWVSSFELVPVPNS